MKRMPAESIDVAALLQQIPSLRGQRWEILKAFFAGWYGELTPTDGFTSTSLQEAEARLGLTLPPALREWYQLAGSRADVWSRQDHLLTPSQLRVEDDRLVLVVENQSVVRWGISLDDMEQDDPPVGITDHDDMDAWVDESPSVSVFALAQMLLNAKFGSKPYCASGHAPVRTIAAATKQYARLGLVELRWPAFPTIFYGDRDLVIETNNDDWVWVSGRSAATFEPAIQLVEQRRVKWEHVERP